MKENVSRITNAIKKVIMIIHQKETDSIVHKNCTMDSKLKMWPFRVTSICMYTKENRRNGMH